MWLGYLDYLDYLLFSNLSRASFILSFRYSLGKETDFTSESKGFWKVYCSFLAVVDWSKLGEGFRLVCVCSFKVCWGCMDILIACLRSSFNSSSLSVYISLLFMPTFSWSCLARYLSTLSLFEMTEILTLLAGRKGVFLLLKISSTISLSAYLESYPSNCSRLIYVMHYNNSAFVTRITREY